MKTQVGKVSKPDLPTENSKVIIWITSNISKENKFGVTPQKTATIYSHYIRKVIFPIMHGLMYPFFVYFFIN